LGSNIIETMDAKEVVIHANIFDILLER